MEWWWWNGGGTVPQEGDIFVNFEMFRVSIFLVCLIHLCYSTRVLSIKAFPINFLTRFVNSKFWMAINSLKRGIIL